MKTLYVSFMNEDSVEIPIASFEELVKCMSECRGPKLHIITFSSGYVLNFENVTYMEVIDNEEE